jgi:flagellar hook protein FlgE
MNVVSNNISNVNTYGFKYGRATFQDMLSMNVSGAAAPTDRKGGVNPRQFGLGMMVATIDNIFTQGSLQTTGKVTDVAVTGEGFFVMKRGDETFYTRAGNFDLDRDGVLVQPANGVKVQGWMARPAADGGTVIDTSASTGDITIPVYGKLPAKASTQVWYKSNLDLQSPVLPAGATPEEIAAQSVVTTIDTYDSEGQVHPVRVRFTHTGVNEWTGQAEVLSKDPNGQEVVLPSQSNVVGPAGTPNPGNTFVLRFDTQGALQSVSDSDGTDLLNQGTLGVQVGFQVEGRNPQTVTLNLGQAGGYTGVTQFASPSTTKAYMQDGYGMGYLESFVVDDNGVVTGSYTNGQRRELAQMALAVFTNPGGLKKAGENFWTETNNSGLANVGSPETGGRGKINSGKLEMSNVDLAEQFTDMIVTERGFQANSRSITTSDQMIQELLTLKR